MEGRGHQLPAGRLVPGDVEDLLGQSGELLNHRSENGLARKREALANGVVLYPGIMAKLGEVAAKHGVTSPKPI